MNQSQHLLDRLRGDGSADRRFRGEGGYVLIMTALLILPLMAFTATAVDVGAWYAQASKMQRAADMAAMSGVVYMPDLVKANTYATKTLQQNGFTSSNATLTIQPPPGITTQLQVSIQQSAPLYFGKLFKSSQTLTRSATAEYNKPVPLGSPNNALGNNLAGYPGCVNPKSTTSPCPNPNNQPQLWAAIQGPYTRHQDGDPYTTKCAGNTVGAGTCDNAGATNGAQNSTYRKTGYLWAVDVPQSLVGTPVTVQLYDAIMCDGTAGGLCGSGVTAGRVNWVGDSAQNNQEMNGEFELFDSDGSDLTISTDPALSLNGKCSTGPGRLLLQGSQSSNAATVDTYKNRWATLCTFTPTKSGIHPMRVRSSAIPGVTDSGGGYNAYAIRATTATATQPRVYAVNDMSLWNNAASSTAKFYLAEIGPEHAGKKLVLDLYDPGDGSGASAFTMQFRMPPGGVPNVIPQNASTVTSCNYNATKSTTIGPATPNSSANCTITTKNAGASSGVYNEGWLRVSIPIPVSYTCSTDCWWSVWYDFGTGSPTDRTVWSVTVIGDPVHLTQ